MKQQRPCTTLAPWLRETGWSLGALTGTDTKALEAAVHIIELYAYDGDASVLAAFRLVVLRMQPTTRGLAHQAIAHVMDWPDRDRLWRLAGLEDPDPPIPLLEYVREAYAGAGVTSDRICTCALHCPESGYHERACCAQRDCDCWCHRDARARQLRADKLDAPRRP